MTARGRLARRLGQLALLVAGALGAPTEGQAQVDPRGAVRTIETTHFLVHFPVALDALARAAAIDAERAFAQLSRELVAPRERIELLVTDNLDLSNGYAQPFPANRVVIYAAPPISARELRFHDAWLRLVITHELAHIFHLDRARGLWGLGRTLLGRAPVTFPNASLPSWVKEGLAVHYESRYTASGRLVGTEFATLARTQALEGTIPPMSRWSLATTRWPRGQTAYAWGSLTMSHAAARSDSAMRQFIEGTAGTLRPPRLRRATRSAFGYTLKQLGRAVTDSLDASVRGVAPGGADADPWQLVSTDGWYAETPRWYGVDSVVWSASTGREVTGVYLAAAPRRGQPADSAIAASRRLARRNGLDVNVPVPGVNALTLVYGQPEWEDPYQLRSDLYRTEVGPDGVRERRLTHGVRLTQPDVRRDGAIVAAQYVPGGARLVRIASTGDSLTPITAALRGDRWADPRWSRDGRRIAAVQLLADGSSRIVVLDTLGRLQVAVAGARGVFASPSFSPDGRRLLWASDRSGRMQLETAPLPAPGVIDTLRWREERPEVRQASRVATALYEPSLSPDGGRVVALRLNGDGMRVVVAPLDTTGPMARSQWYPSTPVATPLEPAPDSARILTLPSRPYNALIASRPRYWLPVTGSGRDGRPTLGFATSGNDILDRQSWYAGATVEPRRREVDGYAAWRYGGLGVPLLDLSANQAWDASYRVTRSDSSLVGVVARRRRFATLAATWSVPHVRWGFTGVTGAQYEWRDFTSDVDAALGEPTSLLRRGTRYPLLFANASFSTAALALRSVSVEEGITLSSNTSYRWRQDQPSLGSWRTVLSARAYRPLGGPGFARHVLALRGAVGIADRNTATEFSAGGVSGLQTAVIPGINVGDPTRPFPVRGIAAGVQRGSRALGATAEYRAPLVMWRRLPSPGAIYLDRASIALFTDAARAWCPGALARTNRTVCETPGTRDGWIASAGAELVVDLGIPFDVPYRLRLGAARPYAAPRDLPRGPAFYATLGGYF